jgi:hypothetical protein
MKSVTFLVIVRCQGNSEEMEQAEATEEEEVVEETTETAAAILHLSCTPFIGLSSFLSFLRSSSFF